MKAEQASATALTVIRGLLLVADRGHYPGLVPQAQVMACQRLLLAVPAGRRLLRQLARPWGHWQSSLLERLVMPGISLHYALRKRFIEDACRKALAAGCTQVVNIGAGFDTLCWRLHQEFPAAHFLEIDHPASSQVKQRALNDFDNEINSNLSFLEADLTVTPLAEVLQAATNFTTEHPAFYICEGVLVYLPEPAVRDLFQTLGRLSRAGSIFAFTAVTPMTSAENNTGLLLRLFLRYFGEPLLWTLERNSLAAFASDQGWHLEQLADDREMLGNLPVPIRLHQGEYLALASIL